MIVLVLLLVAALAASLFVLGFRLADRDEWRQRAISVGQDSIRASRALHGISREAFRQLVDEAERRRRQR